MTRCTSVCPDLDLPCERQQGHVMRHRAEWPDGSHVSWDSKSVELVIECQDATRCTPGGHRD